MDCHTTFPFAIYTPKESCLVSNTFIRFSTSLLHSLALASLPLTSLPRLSLLRSHPSSKTDNYVIGNAASGGWAGLQFPILPEPVDPTLRFTRAVVPKDRPVLLVSGNSVHSSSWFSSNSGAVYDGGSLYWEESDTTSKTLIYNPGRVGTNRLTRMTKDAAGKDAWFRIDNTTVWLVNVGATGWGKRSEYHGFEVRGRREEGGRRRMETGGRTMKHTL